LSASIRSVARLAGVSTATVSRVMNGSAVVKARVRDTVLRAARELKYVPHAGARALATGRTNTVGVLLPEVHGAFFSELIRELDQRAYTHGLRLLLGSLHGDMPEAERILRLTHGQLDGVILMAPFLDVPQHLADVVAGIPMVLLNAPRSIPGCPVFAVDNASGAREVVRHFVALGYRDIAHIAGQPDNLDALERARGFREGLEEAGLSAGPDIPGDYSEHSGYEAGKRIAALARRPRAIFAANDNMAVGCLAALAEAGIRIPEEVAVAGFDDIPLARITRPRLTTVRPPVAEQAARAFAWLLQAIERSPAETARQDCGTTRLATTLVVRASSDPGASDGSDTPARDGTQCPSS
jgi:LacI family transcriptional regulator